METKAKPEWFAVQTRPGAEDVAVQTIGSLGLETFLPRVRAHAGRRLAGGWRIRPFFPSYCFAHFRPVEHLHAVRYSRGVLRVVGTERTPWPVDEAILAEIRSRLGDDGTVTLEPPRMLPGTRVRISTGPLEGWTGIFDRELDDHMRIVVLLEAIQQARLVLRRDELELAEA